MNKLREKPKQVDFTKGTNPVGAASAAIVGKVQEKIR